MIEGLERLTTKRYWAATLLLPFMAFVLAMAAYAAVHGYFGVPEADAGGDLTGLLAGMLEALIWMVAILGFEYAVLIRLYSMNLRDVLSWEKQTGSDTTLGGMPAMFAGGAGFVVALLLGRAVAGDDPFAGDPSLGIMIFTVINGPIIAARIDLGEKRLAAADRPTKDEAP